MRDNAAARGSRRHDEVRPVGFKFGTGTTLKIAEDGEFLIVAKDDGWPASYAWWMGALPEVEVHRRDRLPGEALRVSEGGAGGTRGRDTRHVRDATAPTSRAH